MPLDECIDCERPIDPEDSPPDGRCHPCRAAYLARTRAATPRPATARKSKGKEK